MIRSALIGSAAVLIFGGAAISGVQTDDLPLPVGSRVRVDDDPDGIPVRVITDITTDAAHALVLHVS